MKKLQIIDEPVSSTNNNDRHDITELLFKLAVNTINKPTIRIIIYLFIKVIYCLFYRNHLTKLP